MAQDLERDFRARARRMGLDASSLLVLIMLRSARIAPSAQQIARVADRIASGPEKITAHIAEEEVYERVSRAMDEAPGDLTPSQFRRALMALELEEGWLGRQLGVDSD